MGSKVATINDYVYSDEFMKFIQQNSHQVEALSGDDALELNIKKLESGRIDALIEDKSVMNFNLNLVGQSLRIAGCSNRTGIYIAFAPKSPKAKELLDVLEKWTLRAESSGKLLELKKKYHLID